MQKAHCYEDVWHGCLSLHSVSVLVHVIYPSFNSRPTLFLEARSHYKHHFTIELTPISLAERVLDKKPTHSLAVRLRILPSFNISQTAPCHDRPEEKNPGVSLHNWGVAVNKAIKALEDESEAAGATALDPIPGERFHYVTLLEKSAAVHRRSPRKLIFDISKRSTALLYIDARMILMGLEAYEEEWKTGASGSPKDQVRMCRFDLHQIDEEDRGILVANGTVGLSIPPADNGPPIYVSSL